MSQPIQIDFNFFDQSSATRVSVCREEIRLHLELQEKENLARGMSPVDARHAAQRSFGGVEQVKEILRDRRGVRWLEHLAQDLRYGGRQLAKKKGFAAVAIAILGLGIGATTAIYSVVDKVIFNPVPGPHAERLVQVGEWNKAGGRTELARAGLSPMTLEAVEANRDFFADLARIARIRVLCVPL